MNNLIILQAEKPQIINEIILKVEKGKFVLIFIKFSEKTFY